MVLIDLLQRLAAEEASGVPFVSLYVDARPDPQGRDHFHATVRKELNARVESFPPHSPERESLEHAVQRIMGYLGNDLQPSRNCAGIFVRGDEVFEAIQLEGTVEGHDLQVGAMPHLYPLARLASAHRRYAAVLADTNSARLFVFGVDGGGEAEEISGVKMTRSSQGGWSQARYQRHVEHQHLHHVKEVVDALDGIVRGQGLERIVLIGDEVIVPQLTEKLPKMLADRVVGVLRLEMTASERDVRDATMVVMREQDLREDADKVRRMLDGHRGGGLGVAGIRATRTALENGQVDELLMSAAVGTDGGPPLTTTMADELVRHAYQTAARVTFVADPALLEDVEGVGALLRYRIGTAGNGERKAA
jgi:peptide chain release factor subunit 1